MYTMIMVARWLDGSFKTYSRHSIIASPNLFKTRFKPKMVKD